MSKKAEVQKADCAMPVVAREFLMTKEADLMKAANEFGKGWGIDQREHPRSYWVELHISRWAELCRCAIAYSECFEAKPDDPH